MTRLHRLGSSQIQGSVIGTRDDEYSVEPPGTIVFGINLGSGTVNNGTSFALELECLDVDMDPNTQTGAQFTVRMEISGTTTTLTPTTVNANGWSQAGWTTSGGFRFNTFTKATVNAGDTTSGGDLPQISIFVNGSGSLVIYTNHPSDTFPFTDQTPSNSSNGVFGVVEIIPA